MTQKNLILLLAFSALSLSAQKKEFIGISLNANKISGENIHAGYGIFYENQLSKHHGFEVGLNYRSKGEATWVTVPSPNNYTQMFNIRESYLSMPVMYKFYSDVVNVSTGISFDYYVGWNNLTKMDDFEVTSYTIDPKFYIGWAFRVSKSVPLSSRFVLEPEIYLNPIFKYSYTYYGASIKLKYKL